MITKYIPKHRRPMGWWYFKILCEIGWKLRNVFSFGWRVYYSNLHAMTKRYDINLYGKKFITEQSDIEKAKTADPYYEFHPFNADPVWERVKSELEEIRNNHK